MLKVFFQWLGKLIDAIAYAYDHRNDSDSPIETPPILPQNTPKPPTPTIPPSEAGYSVKTQIWALAIQHWEGGRIQDINTRNHNPGNLKLGAFTKSFPYDHVDARGFLVFLTYKEGFDSLCKFLVNSATGVYKPTYSPDMTLLQYCQKYGDPENDGYAKGIAKEIGVTVETAIRNLI